MNKFSFSKPFKFNHQKVNRKNTFRTRARV